MSEKTMLDKVLENEDDHIKQLVKRAVRENEEKGKRNDTFLLSTIMVSLFVILLAVYIYCSQ